MKALTSIMSIKKIYYGNQWDNGHQCTFTSRRREEKSRYGDELLRDRVQSMNTQWGVRSSPWGKSYRAYHAYPIRVITENKEDQLLSELLEHKKASQNPSIYMRQTDAFNPAWVAEIIHQITFGEDLTREECKELEELIASNVDTFTLSLKEVILIPGAVINLNIPENTAFNLCINQQLLTTKQSKFYNAWVTDMLEAGFIKRAPPELIKCVATTVIAQKAHETG
jgi:hypothetical protein